MRDATLSPDDLHRGAAFVALLVVLFCGVSFWIAYSTNPFKAAATAFGNPWLLVPLFIVALTIHELLHGLGWAVASRFTASVRFGFSRTSFIIFARPTREVSALTYRIGAALPILTLGVVPLAVGWSTRDAALVGWGTWGAAFAAGDLMVLWAIRDVPGAATVLDHPEKAGCLVTDDRSPSSEPAASL